jgi:uncharacterized membrane protein (DUF2068 family)
LNLFEGWHAATWICSIKGHCAPAATVGIVDERENAAGLAVDVDGVWRLSRCLRCDAWVAGPIPTNPEVDRLPPFEQLDLPRRDRELRQAIILRLIAIERGVHSVGFALVAVLGLLLKADLVGVQSTARRLVDSLSKAESQGGRPTNHSILVTEGTKVLHLRASTLNVLIAAAVVYAVIEGVEAVGLWRERRWAEYLTALATAGFLPLEIHELFKKVTLFRLSALVVNLVILVYLVYAKRLFGLARWRPPQSGDIGGPADSAGAPGSDGAPSFPLRWRPLPANEIR